MRKEKNKLKKTDIEAGFVSAQAITLISLVITIILLIILASVAINLSIGKNEIFNRAKEAKEKYEIEQIRETVEIGILDSHLQRETVNDKLTIEGALQDLVEKKIFESIDKQEQLGYIGEYEVKLKYNEEGNVVIEYIQKGAGVKATYTLDPVGYTKEAKVNILFKVQGKVKSVTTPKGLKVYSKNEVVGIDHEVTANGRYKFIIEKEDGSIVEKEVVVDTIDTLPPKDFEITAEVTRTGDLIITANVEDDESETSAKSGIAKIEYYVKLTTASEYTKYDSNEIKGLPSGEYNVYALAYDKAGNDPKQSTNTTQVEIEEWIEIWNEEDLIQVREDVSKGIKRNYILMDNINLTQEWNKIGDENNLFYGQFDGNNKKISNLNNGDKLTKNYEGLFAWIGVNAKVSNLTIEGEITGNNFVGILAGKNVGKIENVKVVGKVTGAASNIGGLVGDSGGTIKKSTSSVEVTGKSSVGGLVGNINTLKTILEECYSSGTVSAYNSCAGGLVGSMLTGTMKKSASEASVYGNYDVGGLIGQNRGVIEDCYSIGDVNELKYDQYHDIGGLVGENYKGTIINTYSISKITIKEGVHYRVGTFYGLNEEGKITNSYSPQRESEDAKKQETYVGFDFENIWIMKEYPELRCFAEE